MYRNTLDMKDHPQQMDTLSLQKNTTDKNQRIGFYMRLESIIKGESKRWKKIINFIYPIIFLFGIFETFYMVLPYFNSYRFDGLMAKIDFLLLGCYPTIWFEQWTHPFLTEVMYLFYLIYFPMPIIILVWLLTKNKLKEIQKELP